MLFKLRGREGEDKVWEIGRPIPRVMEAIYELARLAVYRRFTLSISCANALLL